MIIITGHEVVAAEQRDGFVEAFRDLVARARAFDGCLHFAISADSVDPERVDLTEVWQDFEALKAWRKQARGPRVPKPKSVVITRYDATPADAL